MSFHKDREGRNLRIYIRFYPTTLHATNAFNQERLSNKQDGKVYVIDHTRTIVDYDNGAETWYRKLPNESEMWMYRGIEIQEAPIYVDCEPCESVRLLFRYLTRPK